MKLKCQRQFFAHRFVLFYALKGQQHRRCAGGVAGRKPGATKRGPVVAPEQATTALQARYDIPQTDRIIDRPGYRDGMSRGCRATPVKPANKARWELLSLVARKTAAQRDVERARIGLWVREGHANTVIAQELGGYRRKRPVCGASTLPSEVPKAFARASAVAGHHTSRATCGYS